MEHQKLLVGRKTGVTITEKHLAIHGAAEDMHCLLLRDYIPRKISQSQLRTCEPDSIYGNIYDFLIVKWKRLQSPSIVEWIKMWYIHEME